MHKRIKELVDKSYIYDKKNDSSFFNKELFAKLIVKECVKLRHRNVIVGGVSEYNRGRRELAEDILKHFGVEK